ncbi:hypothetical protein EJB05_40781, partial [Eragrostis curvula]
MNSRRPRSAALCNTNANAGAGAGVPKAKAKTVASRYLSPFSKSTSTMPAPSSATASVAATTSRRSASPAPRRAASTAERVQPPNKISTADAVASSGSGTATTRTLSVAFQTPTYCLDTSSRARSVSPATAAAFSPGKRISSTAAASVRAKVSEGGQNTYRWPSSATGTSSSNDADALATRQEYSVSNYKRAARVGPTRAFDETPRRASVDGASSNEYLRALLSSDTEDSASSGGSRDGLGADKPPATASGPRLSARFARDAVGTRSDRFAYPVSAVASPSPPVKRRPLFNGFLSSSPFSKLPLKKQQSPSKPVGSSFRMTAENPSRPRRSMELPGLAGKLQGKACSLDKTPGPSKAEEEHQLKLLYTRHLQWRHANAQAAAVRSSLRVAAETCWKDVDAALQKTALLIYLFLFFRWQKTLIGAWITILRKRKLLTVTKLQLQLLRDNCKLMAVLRGQMVYLEEWSSLERVYANSFSGTAQALNATVLRLPVSEGAMADIQALKNAVGSAIDVMQRIGYSTSIQLSKLAQANVLVSQLSRVAIQELVLMARCRELLCTLASMHVSEALQSPRAEDTNKPEKAWAFSVVFRLPSPFPN